jgi:glycosyltransferase involved in cell wall biosynthesis
VTIAPALPTPIAGRSAIVHDWFQGYHGAERTVEAMRSGLFAMTNQPDVFTFFAARDLIPSELAVCIVRESRLARLPGIRQREHGRGRWRYLLPLMPRYFARLRLDEYDLVISSSHAFAVNVRPPNAVHLCYCYTPLRYAWLPDVDTRGEHSPSGVALRVLRGRLSEIDRKASRGPDAYVAISEAVRTRIKRFYGRESRVIHPPVDIEDFDPSRPKERGRFLWVNRLVPYKHPLAVAEAFRGTPHRLTMVGTGPLEPALRRALPPNVELHGWLPRQELARLFATASGFVHVGEEDFGISMVEALAAGTPVVALGRGGALDIVRPDADGVLICEPSADEIRAAVDEVACRRWDTSALAARARRFSRERFVEAFRLELERLGVR